VSFVLSLGETQAAVWLKFDSADGAPSKEFPSKNAATIACE